MSGVATTTFPLAKMLLATALLHHAAAQSEAVRGETIAVIREGMRIRAPQQQGPASKPDDNELQRSIRTLTRPCNPAEPAILCTLVLIEVQ